MKLKCALCKRDETEAEFRRLKNEEEVRLSGTQKVRCMACGWKWSYYPYGWFIFKLKEFLAK